ncbi:hypothetical protein [Chryseobacterium sp.]|uniref:hypothetical protein n=1 Tax=Chryseobacterium sp. TaxID=1871047 RepID=UPI0011C7DFA1|nr:hypothetical protein [Chryseobacterium sp.]TXF79582.1 hypothetical protein FUA25_04150 [Chryseobacterium sp.]
MNTAKEKSTDAKSVILTFLIIAFGTIVFIVNGLYLKLLFLALSLGIFIYSNITSKQSKVFTYFIILLILAASVFLIIDHLER